MAVLSPEVKLEGRSRGDEATTLPRGPAQAVQQRTTRPVMAWAPVGTLIVAFEAYVIVRWVTGPYFMQVKPGPTPVPTFMKVTLLFFQVVMIPIALVLFYAFVIRPFRRERRVGVNGVLFLGLCSLWFQDPAGNYGGSEVVYNSSMFNRGSWVADIPGWGSFAKPGAMLMEPLAFTPAAYPVIFMLVAFLGAYVMRKAHTRFPAMGKLGLIGVCFGTMFVFDLLLELVLWLPLGIFEYPGGHWGIFGDTYHKYPIHEGLTIGATFTVTACIKYFIDDRGHSPVERGIETVKGKGGKQLVIRVMAVTAALQVGMLVTYTIPCIWVGQHSTAWPADLQKRSYFTDGICGDGTDRACPAPNVPINTRSSINVTPGGGSVNNTGTTVPGIIPFAR